METNPYRNGATVHYDAAGNPTMQSPRAVVEASFDQGDGTFLYTICVLAQRPGGGFIPQKPDLTGVPQAALVAPGG